jgi:hypothetical protein
MKPSEVFSKSLFWDVDMNQLDWERHAHFIINRSFSRGGTSDVKRVFAQYSDERIKQAVLKSRGVLPKKVAHYLSQLLDIPYANIHVAPEHY